MPQQEEEETEPLRRTRKRKTEATITEQRRKSQKTKTKEATNWWEDATMTSHYDEKTMTAAWRNELKML